MSKLFPLQAVLQLRSRKEEQEERILREIQQAIQEGHTALAHVERLLQQLAEQRVCEVQYRLLAADLQAAAARASQLRQQREQIIRTINALQIRWSDQQKRYLVARMERETLTELHEKHEKSWRLEQASREQKRLDDLMSARRTRG